MYFKLNDNGNKSLFIFFSFFVSYSQTDGILISNSNRVLIPFKKEKLWGYSDEIGTLKIKATYDSVGIFNDGKAKIYKNKMCSFINYNDELLVPLKFDDCIPTSKSHWIVRKYMKFGIVDSKGKILIKTEYEKVYEIMPNYFYLERNGKKGVLNISNNIFKIVIPLKYDSIELNYKDNILICKEKNKIENREINGKIILNSESSNNIESYAVVDSPIEIEWFKPFSRKGKQGLLKLANYSDIYKEFVPAIYDRLDYDSRFIKVQNDGKVGLIDSEDGKNILEVEFDDVDSKLSTLVGSEPFINKFYVKKNGKWGMIGCKKDDYKNKELLIDYKYDSFIKLADYIITESNGGFEIFSLKTLKFVSKKTFQKVYNYLVYFPSQSIILFKYKNKNGEDIYIGENGIEYFSE